MSGPSLVARPSIAPERYAERLNAAQELLRRSGHEALLVGVSADLRYLTGYVAHLTERLTLLVVPASGAATLIAPNLEAMAARVCPAAANGSVSVTGWNETDDPYALVPDLIPESGPGSILVGGTLWAMHVLALQARLPAATFALANATLSELRMRKDAAELDLLRLAAEAADRVIDQISAGPLIGRTEAEVSREIRDRLIDEGHDDASFAIVASGPNAASPHHLASDRRIGAGEPVVLDIGGLLGGYASDTTRTIWVAGPDGSAPDPEFLRIYQLVHDAHAAAADEVHPGVRCESVDRAARHTIESGGYGKAFLHRLGHGIGLDGHEDPYLVDGNATPLEAGMTFSIEPGIYLEGRYGVRLEDIAVCTAEGVDLLNRSSLELRVVQG
jgi:Xaa-Pro aminopeptidase